MQEISEVVDYIFSVETTHTVIGQKLLIAATRKAKPVLDKQKSKEECYRRDIREICKYDHSDNICWVDYRSWVTMPKRLQNSILNLLAPKSWRGVVFPYSLWAEHEQSIVVNMSPDIVLILARDANKKYRIYTIPLYKSYLDWMSPARFKELTQKITNTAIKTYGRTSSNTIYILDQEDNLKEIHI